MWNKVEEKKQAKTSSSANNWTQQILTESSTSKTSFTTPLDSIQKALDKLVNSNLIIKDNDYLHKPEELLNNVSYSITSFGIALIKSAMKIETGIRVYKDLKAAHSSISLVNDFHYVYLVSFSVFSIN